MTTTTYITCPNCKGRGEIEETRGGAGDPEYDVPVTCDLCHGEGETTEDEIDEYINEHGDIDGYTEPTDPRDPYDIEYDK